VSIDRLVLRGIEPSDGRHLVSALQSELSRLLGLRDMRSPWAHSGRTPVLRLGRIPFTPGASGSRALGRRIAQAIIAPRVGR
jgi:hypothetical protein